ncbi:hypothetical protein SAMN04487981_104228 [Streptomyces sp. cf386]|uniref:hypothetical protein n=1 Tax=Streptomyces sp. cf386 TaxID=1761904 RepID=UPI000885233D|nr:hypothetical protein [Streptomyces sp. cf386]SDN25591.1 hypothetical protein SAMN04487981_104228 [Streptomyces sp. cf386]
MRVMTRAGRCALLAVGIVLVVGGCSSGTSDAAGDGGSAGARGSASKSSPSKSTSSKSNVPSRALTQWAGQMCEATELFETAKTNSAIAVKDITDPPDDALIGAEFIAMSYLSETSSSLDEIAGALNDVRQSGIAAADRLHAGLTKEVARVRPKVDELSEAGGYTSPAEDSVDRAGRVGDLVASLKTPEPGLSAVAAEEPKLSAAYRAAPECAPPAPLPEAADATDVAACADGACEILVTKQIHLTVGAWRLRVSLTETKATVRNNDPDGAVGETSLAAGGSGTFGDKNGEVTVKAVAVNKDGAVLSFRTK